MSWSEGLLALVGLFAVLTAATYLVAVMDRCVAVLVAGDAMDLRYCFTAPVSSAARLLSQQRSRTEHPDQLNWRWAATAYLTLAATGLALIPFAPGRALLDVQSGIVLWGALEALTVVVVFLHGWSANSMLPLIGGYRYVAVGLSVMLVSMFVLIAAALPAQSLRLDAIVQSQANVWNLLWQPVGFVLFVALGLSVSLRGPMNYGDSRDLAGGTQAEVSASDQLLWNFARLAMLLSFSAMAATVFLGGYRGAALPGFGWLAIKTLLILIFALACSHGIARITPSRMLSVIWLLLLPLSFFHLLFVGLMTLYGFAHGHH